MLSCRLIQQILSSRRTEAGLPSSLLYPQHPAPVHPINTEKGRKEGREGGGRPSTKVLVLLRGKLWGQSLKIRRTALTEPCSQVAVKQWTEGGWKGHQRICPSPKDSEAGVGTLSGHQLQSFSCNHWQFLTPPSLPPRASQGPRNADLIFLFCLS